MTTENAATEPTEDTENAWMRNSGWVLLFSEVSVAPF
jgi:hypothetical protein